MSRSLNKVMLIGNLTRDPELRYTEGNGTAVATFSIATNRTWTPQNGEKQEDVSFHRIVAWSKLAEICGQYVTKGKKVYIEGRIQYRKWTNKEGVEKDTTEIVAETLILLDGKSADQAEAAPASNDSFPQE